MTLKYGSDESPYRKFLEDSADSATERHTTDDVTTKVVGDFGRWQFWTSLLMSLLKLSNCWYQLNIIFMAPPQEFWCEKPASFSMYTDDEWRSICSPRIEEFPCLIYDPDLLSTTPKIDRTLVPLVPCTNFVYDMSTFTRTMTSDWNLVCTRHWMVHITQCVMMTGVLVGSILFGILADKYGRKIPLMLAIIMQSLASYVACIIPSYWYFVINWFILALASGGITIISFVLCMESVSGKWRMIIPVLYQLPFGLGNAVMAGFAYWLRDWRKLEFALASLSSLYIIYWFFITESPRWLIANGLLDKASEVLERAAKMNKTGWTAEEISHLMPRPRKDRAAAPGFMAFMKSKSMRMKTILLAVNWFCTGLAFYAFSQYLGEIGGNIFVTVSITGIISTPGPIICVFIITRVGRKTTVWVFQFVTALCFVIILLIPRDAFTNDWPRLLFAGIGFAGMAAFVPTLYLYSGELFPTLGRNVGVGGVTTFARIGSMIAPIIVSMDGLVADLPIMLLAVISFAQMLLLVPLPETRNTPLPDTLEEAEQIIKTKRKVNKEATDILQRTE